MFGFYAVRFTPGPNWRPGAPVFEQGLDAHVGYIRGLHEQGKVLLGGPLGDGTGGLTILQDVDEAEAHRLMAADPDVVRQVLTPDIHSWLPIAWDHAVRPSLHETSPLKIQRAKAPQLRSANRVASAE